MKLDESIISAITENKLNVLLLEAGNLNKKDYLLKAFSGSDSLACIPCFNDTLHSLKESIVEYSKRFRLKIDAASIDYLADRLGNDKLLTIQEIKKLSIYANGKSLTYNEVLHSVGDNSIITINKICDHLFNSNKSPYYYEKIIKAGYNNIIVIRSLLNHFYFLLTIKENNNEDFINFPSAIHFSRHLLIRKQIKLLPKEKLKNIILNIHDLEKKSKKDYSLANLLIKRFLLNCSAS